MPKRDFVFRIDQLSSVVIGSPQAASYTTVVAADDDENPVGDDGSITGGIYVGREEGPHVGLWKMSLGGGDYSIYLQAVDTGNQPFFTVGSQDYETNTKWMTIGYPSKGHIRLAVPTSGAGDPEEATDLEVVGEIVDASNVTYTPAVATDWDGDADPGNTDDALDQLAERMDDLEGAAVVKTIMFFVAGDLSVTSSPIRVHAPEAMTVTNVTAAVNTAPTGAAVIVDVNKNGTTMFTTQGNRPQIAAAGTEDLSSVPDVTSIAQNDVITIDVDQVGSSTVGADLVVQVRCTAP